MIKPINDRVLATLIEAEETDIDGMPDTSKPLDKYAQVKVVRSSTKDYKRGDVLIVPAYVDTVKDGKKEYCIFHVSDVVATCE